VTVSASDGTLTTNQPFTWTVTKVERAPVITAIPNQTSPESAVIALQVVASDPDGDPVTFSATGLPAPLTINAATGLISGTLTANVGFESYELGPRDSIAFDSSTPHEYLNKTGEVVHAIWVVVHSEPGRA